MGTPKIYIGSFDVADGNGFGKEHIYLYYDPDVDGDGDVLTYDVNNSAAQPYILRGGPDSGIASGNIIVEVLPESDSTDSFAIDKNGDDLPDTPQERNFVVLLEGSDAVLSWNELIAFAKTLGDDVGGGEYETRVDYKLLGPNSNSVANTLLSYLNIDLRTNTPLNEGQPGTHQSPYEYPGHMGLIDGSGNDVLRGFAYDDGTYKFYDNTGNDYLILDNGATAIMTGKDDDGTTFNNIVMTGYTAPNYQDLYLSVTGTDYKVSDGLLALNDILTVEDHFEQTYHTKYLIVSPNPEVAVKANTDKVLLSDGQTVADILKWIDTRLLNADDFRDAAIKLQNVQTALYNAPNMSGTDENDLIYGDAQNNTITGSLGNDKIYGAQGDDTLDYVAFTTNLHVDFDNHFVKHADGSQVYFEEIEHVITGAGNDTIKGSSGDDILEGNDGEDTFYGTDGVDEIDGGAGRDVVDYSQITDQNITVFYSSFDNSVTASLEDVARKVIDTDIILNAEIIRGTAMADEFFAYLHIVTGNVDIDMSFDGGGQEDGARDVLNMWGHAGDIVIDMNSGVAGDINAAHLTFTNFEKVIGGNGNDTIIGDDLDNWLDGHTGDDVLYGGGGNDVLVTRPDTYGGATRASSGVDTLHGGDGNDTYYIDSEPVFIRDTSGIDTIIFGHGFGRSPNILTPQNDSSDGYYQDNYGLASTYDFDLSEIEYIGYVDGVVFASEDLFRWDLTRHWSAPYSFNANSLSDANIGDSVVIGDAENNRIISNTGNDTYNGGDGFDVVVYADYSAEYDFANPMVINLSTGSVTGKAQYDDPNNVLPSSLISDFNGTDRLIDIEGVIIESGEDDTITGTDELNYISTSGGHDTVYGLGGDDVIISRTDDSVIYGGDGHDNLNGYGTFYGGAGNDVIRGFGTLYGEDGTDILIALDNTSTLNGGAGNDYLEGVVESDAAIETLFMVGEGQDVVKGAGTLWLQNGTWETLKFYQASNNSLIIDTGTGEVVVQDYFLRGGDYYQLDARPTDILQITFDNQTFHNISEDNIMLQTSVYDDYFDLSAQNNTYVADGAGYDLLRSYTGFKDEMHNTYVFDQDFSGIVSIYTDGRAQEKIVLDGVSDVNDVVFIRDYDADDAAADLNLYYYDDIRIKYGTNGTVYLRDVDTKDLSNIVISINGQDYGLDNWALSVYQPFNTLSDANTGGFTSFDHAVVYGDGSDDYYSAGASHDTFYGEGGRDSFFGGEGDDVIFGGDGSDYLEGGADNDILQGGIGRDTLNGGDGDDVLYTHEASIVLHEGDGSTTQYSNAENNVLIGGAGADRFVIEKRADNDRLASADKIADFSLAEGDIIDLTSWNITDYSVIADSIEDGFYYFVTGEQNSDAVTIHLGESLLVLEGIGIDEVSSAFFDFGIDNSNNHAPVANNDSIIIDPMDYDVQEFFYIDVAANDYDRDGDNLSIRFTEYPDYGDVYIDGEEIEYQIYYDLISFDPDAPLPQIVDSFSYMIDDGKGGSDIATVNIVVDLYNPAPYADDDYASVDVGSDVIIDVLANDYDYLGEALSVLFVSASELATVVLNPDQTVTYTPNPDANGLDTLSYKIIDASGFAATGHVYVTVNGNNQPPVANDVNQSVNEDELLSFNILNYVSDADGDIIALTGVSGAANGQISFDSNGLVTYQPDENYNGTETLNYTVDDGNGNLVQAALTISIAPVNDNPVAANDAVSTDENQAVTISAAQLLANDNDVDGDALMIANITAAQDGTAVLNNGSVTFTPDADFYGQAGFSYTVSDGNGGTSTAQVSVTVNPVNDDIIIGGNGDDTLSGTYQGDTIDGGEGQDTITAGQGNDTVNGGGGNDVIYGQDDDDLLYGDDGFDQIFAGQGNNEIHGGAGEDLLAGGAYSDVIYGEGEDDLLLGNNGDDVLNGGAGNDTLLGGQGDDVLLFGEGDDILTGGKGADVFKVVDTDDLGTATIKDFNVDAGDSLDISNILEGYDPLADVLSDFVKVETNSSQASVYVDRDGQGTDHAWEQLALMQIQGASNISNDEDQLVNDGILVI